MPFVLSLSKGGDGSCPFMVRQAHHERVVLIIIEASYFCMRCVCPRRMVANLGPNQVLQPQQSRQIARSNLGDLCNADPLQVGQLLGYF